jgi:hypothetical protein
MSPVGIGVRSLFCIPLLEINFYFEKNELKSILDLHHPRLLQDRGWL